MPRLPNPYTRVSIYQIEGQVDPRDVLRALYLDHEEFETWAIRLGTRDGFFVGGTIQKEHASWAEVVAGWVGDSEVVAGLGNTTAAAVVLLPTQADDSGLVWALCFGMGFHLIEPSRMVPDLGRRLAVRCAAPDLLRSITHSRLDSRAYVARTSIPGGDDIGAFGASELGDLISRMVGPADLDGLLASDDGKRAEIRGADAINIPLARDPDRLIEDLDAIEALLERDPLPELASIEQLRGLKAKDPVIPDLDAALDVALGASDEPNLGLAWPTELADEAAPLAYFEISGLPSGHQERGLDLETLLSEVRELPPGERAHRLQRMKVQAFADEDDAVSSLLPAKQWLSFETTLNGHRYCMHNGKWYAVDEGLDQLLTDRLGAIFDAEPPIAGLPPWSVETDEEEYNNSLAQQVHGICLDRKLVRCESIPRGFEACDVLTPEGVFIHVKMVGRSTGASHLFAQAGVSAQALIEDATARAALLEVVEASGGESAWVPDSPRDVVLVMGNNTKKIDAGSLFSFSRMRLARLADECRRQRLNLTIASIVRSKVPA